MSTEAKKPSLDEVLAYVEKSLNYNVQRYGKKLPKEHQDEIKQEARMKILERYPKIRPEGWKAYISQICAGTVKDYKKQGTGFEDGFGWVRFDNLSSEDDEISVDKVLSSNGVFTKADPLKIEIKWDLLEKMASVDQRLLAFLKQIRSEKLKDIAPNLGVSVSRADQLINEFIAKFDDPEEAENPWMIQTAYALGISELLGLPNRPICVNEGFMVGEKLTPINLDDESIHENVRIKDAQQSFDLT